MLIHRLADPRNMREGRQNFRRNAVEPRRKPSAHPPNRDVGETYFIAEDKVALRRDHFIQNEQFASQAVFGEFGALSGLYRRFFISAGENDQLGDIGRDIYELIGLRGQQGVIGRVKA